LADERRNHRGNGCHCRLARARSGDATPTRPGVREENLGSVPGPTAALRRDRRRPRRDDLLTAASKINAKVYGFGMSGRLLPVDRALCLAVAFTLLTGQASLRYRS